MKYSWNIDQLHRELSPSGVIGLIVFSVVVMGVLPASVFGQRAASNQPFIGFRSFEGSQRSSIGSPSSNVRSSAGGLRSPNTNGPDVYPYPAAGAPGQRPSFRQRGSLPVQTHVDSQMRRNDVSTGDLNHTGHATAPLVDRSTGWNVRRNAASTAGTTPFRAQAAPVGVPSRPVSSTVPTATRRNFVAPAPRSTSRLNQSVVQQVNSTMKSSNRNPSAATATNRQATSGVTRVAKVPQAACCVPNPNCCYPNQPAASYAPALNRGPTGPGNQIAYQAPAGYQYQPYQFQPNLGVPQFGNRRNVLTPFFTGSGVYTPLLKLQDLPARTYFGQGIIGQPKAYVDGQIVRNLLRYIFP